MEIDSLNLTETIQLLMKRKKISYQDLADLLDLNDTTVWRAVHIPLRAASATLFRVVKYLDISWPDFDRLFTRELDK